MLDSAVKACSAKIRRACDKYQQPEHAWLYSLIIGHAFNTVAKKLAGTSWRRWLNSEFSLKEQEALIFMEHADQFIWTD